VAGYLQYDDAGIYSSTSFIWVKDINYSVPPTGDGDTLRLLLCAILVAMLGMGCVLVYRKHQKTFSN